MTKDYKRNPEIEEIETREWLYSLDYVFEHGGPERVRELLQQLQIRAHKAGVQIPFSANTPYINTIPREKQPPFPGNREIERRIKSLIRWNAMAMVVNANKMEEGIGGHISTYASAATYMRSASIISSKEKVKVTTAIRFISRDTLHREFMLVLFLKEEFQKRK